MEINKNKKTTINIPKDLHLKTKKYALETGATMTEIIIKALERLQL